MTTKGEATVTGEDNLTLTDSKVAPGPAEVDKVSTIAAASVAPGPGSADTKNDGKRKPAIVIFFKKILILLWKCSLQKRRAFCLLFWEIFFTIAFGSILLAGGTISFAGQRYPGDDLPTINSVSYVNIIKDIPENGTVYYTPDNSNTKKIIGKMIEKLTEFERKDTRFVPAKSEAVIEAHFNKIAFDEDKRKDFVGAIVFQKYTKSEVKYKIRFPLVGGRSEQRTNFILPPVNQLFSNEKSPDYENERDDPHKRIYRPEFGEDHPFYLQRGLLGLQIVTDEGAAVALTSKAFQGEVDLNEFPYYGPRMYGDMKWLVIFMSIVILFIFLFLNSFVARNVVGEKETGIKELLKLSGYPGWMQWLAWYIIAIIMGIIYSSFLVFIWFVIPAYNYKSNDPMITRGDPSVWLFVLILGATSNVAIVFFACAFFKSAALATGVITISSLAGSIGIPFLGTSYFFSAGLYNSAALMGMSLLPQCGLVIGVSFLLAFENLAEDGARWSKMGDEIPGHPGLCLGYVILMFLADIVIYVLLGTYFESILPSEHGIRKPWYYPVSPIINLVKNRKGKAKSPQIKDLASKMTVTEGGGGGGGGFEKREVSKPVGVVVKNIVKKFDQKIAVNDVSLTLYDGEIFALLGHNGAGKTTLISILSGMLSATSGTATIHGYDIKDDIEMIRKSLGLCPQHNMLFNSLTVMEHLMLFGAMKDKDCKSVELEAQALLEMMQLGDAGKANARTLSGGQKRKLCLAMALIGGAKIVIADEPTSGMDPEARRAIWDILLKVRGERTILLTTHFMEEADALGDHIAIMADGKIQCSGTPAFLKSYYGTGFTLKVSLLPDGNKKAVLLAVQKHIPDASMKPIKMDHEMFITLPTETATSSALSGLFSTLTEKKQELKIDTLGLSMSSMDEVFVKVGELASTGIPHDAVTLDAPNPSTTGSTVQEPSELKSEAQADAVPDPDPEQPESSTAPGPPKGDTVDKPKGFQIQKIFMQILAVILKQGFYLRRNLFLTLFMLIFPAIMVMIFTLGVSSDIVPEKPSQPLEIKLGSYSSPITVYTASNKNLQKRVKNLISSNSEAVFTKDVNATLWKAGNDGRSFKRKYIVACGMNGSSFTAWYNKFAIHSPPLAINLASNARAPPGFRISVSIHPLETPESLIIDVASTIKDKHKDIARSMDIIIGMLLFTLASCFLVQPISECVNKSKHLQLMTGINPILYWMTTFIFDMIFWTLIVTIMIMFIAICQVYGFFTTSDGLAAIFMLLEGFGTFVIPLVYLFSRIPKTVAGGIPLIILTLFVPIIVVVFSAGGLGNPEVDQEAVRKRLSWVMRFFPYPSTEFSFSYIAKVLTVNAKCNYFTDKVPQVLCTASSGAEYRDLKGCCKNCKALKVPCFIPKESLTWEMPLIFHGNIFAILIPGILQFVICDIILGIICLAVHILIDSHLLWCVLGKESDFQDPVQDDDVQAENQRVIGMVVSNQKSEDAFIVDNLSKNYGNFAAVSKITFGVHHGECFGLLGTNGAGKTTTFRMITGDVVPSCGDAYEGPIFLSKNRRTFLSNIGYCPQFDAFIPSLTGRENLLIFALLRGMKFSQGRLEAQKWLEKVGLEKDGNARAQNYSGGMKRRLSAAVAMLGDPPLILMDEPTSGVDPISRRQFWKVLESLRDSKNQSVILTSHSMDECEMLCSRLGIMVNGQLQCLGGVQHLKHKFAQGYTLTLKLKDMIPGEKIENAGGAVSEMDKMIKEKFLPCLLKEQHDTLLKYQIMNTNLGWDMLYRTLEEVKKSYSSLIEDYSVSETTLEEVFLSFAQKQDELNKGKKKLPVLPTQGQTQ